MESLDQSKRINTLFAVVKILQGQIDELERTHEITVKELDTKIDELSYRVDANESDIDHLRNEDRWS